MKLTKKLEAEVLKVYHTYWDSYSNGDIKTFAGTLDKTFEMIGTSESEIGHTREDGIKFLKAQIKELVGKVEMRNRKISVVPVNELLLVNERCDIYILNGQDWSFYSKIRISTFLRKTTSGWKVFQQHGSLPDMRVQEGETLALKKISKENLQLRDAIKRRTIELENKNRELEIETALEKVRAIALGMKKPEDMLAICKTISKQLAALGVKEIRNIQTGIFNVQKGSYMNYQYYAKHDKTFITDTVYTDHKVAKRFVTKMLKGKGQFSVTHIRGKQKLKEWIAYQKGTNFFLDKYLYTASSLHYYWYSLGPVALGISTYRQLTKDEWALFQRFLNVFELAYRRYMDIEKAEAQAKEARIEAALEKVRAQAMAMHRPDDILNVCKTIFKELPPLGFSDVRNALINFWDDASDSLIDYDYSDLTGGNVAKLAYSSHPVFEQFQKKIRGSKDAFAQLVVTKSQLASWRKRRRDSGEYEDPRLKKIDALYYYFYSIGVGAVGISSFKPLTAENIELLKRFRNVFDLAYRRYLDIQKAQAQAREAQIEAALERVRAASMAMQDSSALSGIIYKLYGELTKLDAKLDRCFIMIVNPENKGITWWMAGQEGLLAENGFFVQMNQHHSHLMYLDYCKKRKKKWTYLFEGKEKRDWDRFGFSKTELARLPEPVKKFMASAKKVYLSGSSDQFGSLVTGSFAPLPEEQQDIISRFTIAFNQAYIRFLDLQKAEAQAREAQIETALERVRSRSMGMHNSGELKEVIRLVLQQFVHLNINVEHAGFYIDYKVHDDMHIWLADPNIEPFFAVIPYFDTPTWNSFLEAKAKGTTLHTDLLDFKTKNKFYKSLFKLFTVPREAQQFYLQCKGLAVSTVLLDNVGLYIENFSAIPYTDEENEILIRIGKVFQQTYTRFLDLQKAEAQAREAEIELALERVRARTMAMQQSNELPAAAAILFQQVQSLGMPAWSAGYCIWNEDKSAVTLWMSSEGVLQPPFTAPTTEDELFIQMRKGQEEGKAFHVVEMGGKKLVKHYQYMRTLPVVGEILDSIINAGHPLPTFQIMHHAYFSKGFLLFITYEPVPDAHDIFKRFGKVFDQTYTRFLDLQKAEAQAKEAQIETSLERVRAQAMAMHKPDDLLNVSEVMFKELTALGFNKLRNTMIHTFNDKNDFFMDYDYSGTIGAQISKIPTKGIEIIDRYWTEIKKGTDTFLEFRISGKELQRWKNFRKTTNQLDDPRIASADSLYYYYYSIGMGDIGVSTFSPLSYDKIEILERFKNVFQLSYQRYVDLQKAEAQAREATIEAALERVRSRSLAMHKSDELLEVVTVIFEQLKTLGLQLWNCGILRFHSKQSSDAEIWMTRPDGKMMGQSFVIPLDKVPVYKKLYKAWKSMEEIHIESLQDKHIIKHHNSIASLNIIPVDKMKREAGRELPRQMFFHSINFSDGILSVITTEAISDKILLIRFGNTFKQSYTRFLDLQKAEAQAREAQIEAALERVRSRSLAMHRSDELNEVVTVLFEKLKDLNIKVTAVGISINIEGSKDWNNYVCGENESGIVINNYRLPYFNHRIANDLFEAWENGLEFFVGHYSKEEKDSFYEYVIEHSELKNEFPDEIKQFIFQSPSYTISVATTKHTMININDFEGKSLSDNGTDILKRFSKVFDQAYTRFLDLQKAEAQAKEALIEASLERVRSKTMAMHQSSELNEAAELLYKELTKLGIEKLTCGYTLLHDKVYTGTCYMANPEGNFAWEPFYLDHSGSPGFLSMYESWKKQEPFHSFELSGKANVEHNKYLAEHAENFPIPTEMLLAILPPVTHSNSFNFRFGYLLVVSLSHFTSEQTDIIKRFTKVFEQTYTRFLDLQKAEARAREAKIEAALERTRTQSMLMQHSGELNQTISVFHEQLQWLGIDSEFSYLWLPDEEKSTHLFLATWGETENGLTIFKNKEVVYPLDKSEPSIAACYIAWESGDPVHVNPVLPKNIKTYFETWSELLGGIKKFSHTNFKNGLFYVDAYMKYGCFGVVIKRQLTDDEKKILNRFSIEFERTYTRFLDLQKAEAQAKEAQIEAALEKVRSRSLAMQKPGELTEVAELLRKEMGQLGVEELETSSIYIVDKEKMQAECWYAIKDIREENKQLVSDEMTITFADTWVSTEMWKFYLSQKEQASIVMKGDNRKEWINYCAEESQVLQGYYGNEIPERTYHLVKFSGGYMGAASPGDISAESWDLLRRAASVFSLAYTRFNDLQIAEAHAQQAEQDLIAIKEAKQKAEEALTELQSTQKQLIQSEKMASLGELTAGIAHEIQNPLNFVNNFSEVSKELLDEMREAIEKGDAEEAKEIMNDVIQNLEKINHHGKRADGIVKGMLQHSRSSSNQKEATNINALADEYLRLAYHGLRAKDKSFNATMKTDFDETIGDINIIPQDIGRVILNLITNAFYVVNEKSKQNITGYEPTVEVSTKKEGNKILVSVKDNGRGIPQKILDKIFQPFFTTKPTGQGTGLGLSLSYDIVKVHGGELKVETTEGEGSKFIIILPSNK